MNTPTDLMGEVLEARKKGIAVGHFNICSIDMFHAVADTAKSLSLPVVIGVSEGERDYVGINEIVSLVKMRRANGERIYLNADHTYSISRVKEAIDAGYDSVIYDAAKEPLEKNIADTKVCVEYARSKNSPVLIEGEVGYIGSSSKILHEVPDNVAKEEFMTKREDAIRYVEETGVHMLAPAVGNLHGMLASGHNPELNIKKVEEIAGAVQAPLVLHGGSGTSDVDFRNAIKAGISLVHVSTELRLAYRTALHAYLNEHPEEVAPYRYLQPAKDAVVKVVENRLKLFAGL
jgi:fructose-bisphosphate aldolase, class II